MALVTPFKCGRKRGVGGIKCGEREEIEHLIDHFGERGTSAALVDQRDALAIRRISEFDGDCR